MTKSIEDLFTTFTCCLCGEEVREFGNNPFPLKRKHPFPNGSGRCCDRCNASYVVPIRLILWPNDFEVEG